MSDDVQCPECNGEGSRAVGPVDMFGVEDHVQYCRLCDGEETVSQAVADDCNRSAGEDLSRLKFIEELGRDPTYHELDELDALRKARREDPRAHHESCRCRRCDPNMWRERGAA